VYAVLYTGPQLCYTEQCRHYDHGLTIRSERPSFKSVHKNNTALLLLLLIFILMVEHSVQNKYGTPVTQTLRKNPISDEALINKMQRFARIVPEENFRLQNDTYTVAVIFRF